MNERIREIAEQAGFKVNWHNADVQAIKMARLEKFAELIIRECADFADEHNSEVEGVTLGIGKAIKQHFGVEQDVNETLRNRSTYFGNDI